MRTKCLTLLVASSISLLHAQSWNSMNVGAASDVLCISFPTNDTGYVSLANGQIRKTTNGALNWTQCTLNTGVAQNLEFVNGTRGFIVDGSDVQATSDGGQTWTPIITNNSLTFYDVCFATPAVGFASATTANIDTLFIYKTIDGGSTWNLLPAVTGPFNPFFPKLYFVSATTGFVSAEAHTLRTTDGGLTWVSEFVEPNADIYYSMHSPDGVNIFAGYHSAAFASSADGGDNWMPSPTYTNYPGFGVYFTSGTHGWYCGGNGFSSGAIEETNDGGLTWTPDHVGNSFWCMEFPSPAVGYVGGTNGIIVKYTDPTNATDISREKISVHPNPTVDFLNIENIEINSQLTITNSLGQIIFEQNTAESKVQIDVSTFAPGIYSLLVSDENGIRSQSFVVN